MRFILVLSTFLFAACANNPENECGDRFLLPMPTDGGVEFKEVSLTTLGSPYRLKGAAAEIFVEGSLTADGYSGSVAQPKLTRSGHVCVPMDTSSALALSTYAHFEQIYNFDRELGVNKQISWPRKVGIELRLRSPDGQTHNNAHYFGRSDSIGILPYSLRGMHVTLNRGILAHEHFHAHFQAQVLNPLSTGDDVISSAFERLFYSTFAVKPSVEDLDNADIRTNSGLNRFVLRAWNEGLADFYGAVFAGEPDFFSRTLPYLSAFRALEGPLNLFRPGEALRPTVQFTGRGDEVEYRKEMVGIAYQQGTLLARLLYRLSSNDRSERKQFLARVLRQLHRIPALVGPQMERRILDFDMVVPLLLEGAELDQEDCRALAATISKDSVLRSIRPCAR